MSQYLNWKGAVLLFLYERGLERPSEPYVMGTEIRELAIEQHLNPTVITHDLIIDGLVIIPSPDRYALTEYGKLQAERIKRFVATTPK